MMAPSMNSFRCKLVTRKLVGDSNSEGPNFQENSVLDLDTSDSSPKVIVSVLTTIVNFFMTRLDADMKNGVSNSSRIGDTSDQNGKAFSKRHDRITV